MEKGKQTVDEACSSWSKLLEIRAVEVSVLIFYSTFLENYG